MKKGISFEKQLKKEPLIPSQEKFIEFTSTIWSKEHQKEVVLLKRLKNKRTQNTPNNHFKIELLDAKNIYHTSDIKKIKKESKSRFLPSNYFKGDIPFEAILKIKAIEKTHETAFYNFKIIVPSKLLRLKKIDDLLLFIPLNDGYYYLVHKWRNNLHPLRIIWLGVLRVFKI